MEENTILEERELPEKQGILSSKRYATTTNGSVIRETGIAFCDGCGYRLDSNRATIICCVCRKKLCTSPSCSIDYAGRHYCEDDLQRILPLERLQFKIIHGLSCNLGLTEVRDLVRCQKEDFNSALKELVARKFVEKTGLSLFSRYEVLDRGILAWKTYYKAFTENGDVAYFVEEVNNHVKEKDRNAVERCYGDIS